MKKFKKVIALESSAAPALSVSMEMTETGACGILLMDKRKKCWSA